MGEKVPDFGPRLRELREAAGLTQKQLAERAELHYMTLVKLERGERVPSWETVVQVSRVLGCSCEAFLTPATNPEPETRRGRPPKREEVEPEPEPPSKPKGQRAKNG